MPEGDNLFRAASTLNRALAGTQVTRFESVFPALNRIDEDEPLAGRQVDSVAAAGKHLLMRFSGELVLRTHMRMSGSWHIYRPGEAWQRPSRDMRIVVATATFVAVAFNVHVAEFLRGKELERQRDLRAMGPDLLGERFDADEAIARLRARGGETIEVALLNQRVVAGIGNVYKSEVLFACGVNPFGLVSSLHEATLATLLQTARKFMKANVTATSPEGIVTYAGLRRTTGRSNAAERLWVYARAGLPCRNCGAAILSAKTGPDVRSTYWCPRCQAGSGG